VLAVLATVCASTATAQDRGAVLFADRCAACHGADATGISGPDLTRLASTGITDDRLFQIIRSGVPGSIMPPSNAPDDEIRALVAYVRSLAPAVAAAGAGSSRGEQIFTTACASCHRIGGRGGRLGPDLSRIGETRNAEALTRSIRDPGAAIATGYRTVTIVTQDGGRIQGIRKGEDAFSVQLMDTTERLRGYRKSDVREVVRETSSLMPSFGVDRLSDEDLEELVQFLAAQRRSQK
jgi:putative heme-binding domain-containing protein